MYMRFCLPGGKCAAAVRWPICTTGCCSQCQQIHIWPDAQSAPWWTAKNRHKNIHQTKSLLMNNMSVLTNARAKNNQSPEWHNHYYFLQSKQSFSRLKLLFNFASSQTSDFKISVSMEIHKSLTKKQLVLRYSFVHFSLFKNDPCCSSSDWILSTDKNNLMSEFCRLNECLLWSFLLLEFDLQIMLLFTDSYGVGVGDGGGWLITDLEDDEEEVLLLASCCLQSFLHAFNHILCGYLLVWENLHPVSLLSPWQQKNHQHMQLLNENCLTQLCSNTYTRYNICLYKQHCFLTYKLPSTFYPLRPVTQAQHQWPESPTLPLTQHACEYKVHKLHNYCPSIISTNSTSTIK